MALEPSGLELANYGTVGWNAIYSSNFQKLNDYLAKFEDLWNSTPDNWNILRYDDSSSKWIKDTIANLSTQLESYLAKIDLSNVDDNTILTKLKNVDGSGSGLDADLLDGKEGNEYLDKATYDNDNDGKVENADYADSAGNADTVDGFHADTSPTPLTIPVADSSGYINDWINQGEGSNLNADLLDGYDTSQVPNAHVIPVTDSSGQLSKDWIKVVKKTITSDYTTDSEDQYLFVDASSGNISITLTTNEDQEVVIKKIDSSTNTVTITPSSGNIEGSTSLTLSSQYEYCRVFCDGTNWWKV